MAKISTIRLSDRTKQRLRALQYAPSETYESIILRLLETKIGNEVVEYLVYNEKCENCWIKLAIDWSNPMNNIQFLTRDSKLTSTFPIYNYEDKDEQDRWEKFREDVLDLENIQSMCAILGEGQTLHLGELAIKRV